MPKARCVYCTETKPLENFKKAEHVIPRAFCRGFNEALTLAPSQRPAVCDSCNQHFGNTLEFALGRDSYEAVLRLAYGAKRPADAHEVRGSRLRVTLPARSRLGPVHLQFAEAPKDPRPAIEPVPQARFRLRNGGYISYSESTLKSADPRENTKVDPNQVLLLWPGRDPQARYRLKRLLARYGIRPLQWAEATGLPQPGDPFDFDLEVRAVLDHVIARSIAKIAFNYLVRVTYDDDPLFALKPDFDPARSFIMGAGGDWRKFVILSERPILATDSERRRSTRGHLLTVRWKRFGGMIAQVSLFNDLTYKVVLAPKMRGVWRELSSGHHYNPESRSVEPLGRTGLVVPPRLWIAGSSTR